MSGAPAYGAPRITDIPPLSKRKITRPGLGKVDPNDYRNTSAPPPRTSRIVERGAPAASTPPAEASLALEALGDRVNRSRR